MRKWLGIAGAIALAACSPAHVQTPNQSASGQTTSQLPPSTVSPTTTDWPNIRGGDIGLTYLALDKRIVRLTVSEDTAYLYVQFRPTDVGGMTEAATEPRNIAVLLSMPENDLPDYASKFIFYLKDKDGEYLGSLTFDVSDLRRRGVKTLSDGKLLSLATSVEFTGAGQALAAIFCDAHEVGAIKFCGML